MNLKTLAGVFGAVFLLIGVLGFVPGITNDDGLLLGIFEVNALHNAVHLLTGVAALVAASNASYAKMYFQVFGVVYALVTVLGFIASDGNVLGLDLLYFNTADNILHLVIAAAALGIGFGMKAEPAAA